MVGTIAPAVCGPGQFSTWYRLICIYGLSQIGGSALTGLILGATGLILQTSLHWEITALASALAFLATLGGLRDLKLLAFWLPSRCWQVPQSWKRFPPSVMAGLFGFGIGMGVLTRIPFASFYVVLLACLGLANIPVGVGLMALYGTTRALTVALVARGQNSAINPRERIETVARLSPVAGYLDGLVLTLVAGLSLGLFLSPQT